MATCATCKEEKAPSDFSPDRRRPCGHQSTCKQCVRLASEKKRRAAGASSLKEKSAACRAEFKACSKCGSLWPNTLEHFAPNNRTDTLQAMCRECNRKLARTEESRARNREAVKTKEARARRAATMRRWRAEHREQSIAHARVKYAIRTGALVRGPCQSCGSSATEAHHHNGYSKEHWLDVVWLCKLCHETEHRLAVAS